MAGGKWVSILDPKVLKVGMKVSTCLDMDHPCGNDDANDDDGEFYWFTATIEDIHAPFHGDADYPAGSVQVDVRRRDHDGGLWHTILTEDSLPYMKIWVISDWDD